MGILSSTQYLQNKIALLKAFKSLSSRMSPYQSLTLHLSPSPSQSPPLSSSLSLLIYLCVPSLSPSLSLSHSTYYPPSLTYVSTSLTLPSSHTLSLLSPLSLTPFISACPSISLSLSPSPSLLHPDCDVDTCGCHGNPSLV